MSEHLPPLPRGWTTSHSLAYLFLGVALADGVVDTVETDKAVEILSHHDATFEDEANHILAEANAHLDEIHAAPGRDGWFTTLDTHFAVLANRLGKPMLQAALQDMISVAMADGHFAPEEVMLVQAAAARWGIGAEA